MEGKCQSFIIGRLPAGVPTAECMCVYPFVPAFSQGFMLVLCYR